MPDMSLAFPGRYMKAADLPQPKILTITNVEHMLALTRNLSRREHGGKPYA